MKFALSILLFLILCCSVQAQESVWNSSTGSAVKMLVGADGRPTRVTLIADGKKPLQYQIINVSKNGFSYMAGQAKMEARYTGTDELTITNTSGSGVFRWTKRNGRAQNPIPSGEECEKTFWRNEDRSRIYMMLSTPTSASIMINSKVGGKSRIVAYPAGWIEYPKRLSYGTSNKTTLRFLNPMLFKVGRSFFFQSHPDYEDK